MLQACCCPALPALVIWIWTVLEGALERLLARFLGSLMVDVKSVFTKVVLPTPDSPIPSPLHEYRIHNHLSSMGLLTAHHQSKVGTILCYNLVSLIG